MSHADEDLERLLAQGHLSGATYDRIEANVLERVAPEPRRRRSPWLCAAVLPAAAALGGLSLFLGRPAPSAEAGFTPKGSATALAGAVELACSAERACRVGDTLVFVVDTGVARGYLNASAQRVEPPSAERIRLFPSARGESPRLAAGAGTTVVPEGVRLNGAFGPGVYRIDIWFSDDAPSPEPRGGRTTSVELRIE